MSDGVLLLKLLHILGATVLLGTGLGIAFFMWMAHRTGVPKLIAHTAGIVVIADVVFTLVAVILQPATGLGLAFAMGYSVLEPWIVASLGLFVLVGVCWLPVVWLQIRMEALAKAAADADTPLSAEYHRMFRCWFWLGWPGFGGVLAIFALMIWRPAFG
jgi:uncharacterized membrane protein